MIISSREFQRETGKHIEAAANGETIVVTRHGLPSVVIVSHEQWSKVCFDDPKWRTILDKMRVKWPNKDDHELIVELLQRWEWQQDSNSSKDAKLSKIYELLLWVARKLGYSE